jgi:membrane-associated phospholipid phosphatase
MQQILAWDRSILKLRNSQWHNSFLDSVLPFFRIAEFWVPLYLFLIVFVLLNNKKNGLYWVILAILTSIITNFISSDIVKENIKRLRPCNDPINASWFRALDNLSFPQSSSFTSSHAANHFGIAFFIMLTCAPYFGKWRFLFLLWASLVCYTQMYVGVHYFTDILGGAAIGLIVGLLASKVYNHINQKSI